MRYAEYKKLKENRGLHKIKKIASEGQAICSRCGATIKHVYVIDTAPGSYLGSECIYKALPDSLSDREKKLLIKLS